MAKPVVVNLAACQASLESTLAKLTCVANAELDDLKRWQDRREWCTSGPVLHRLIWLARLPMLNWRIKRSIDRVTTLVELLDMIHESLVK